MLTVTSEEGFISVMHKSEATLIMWTWTRLVQQHCICIGHSSFVTFSCFLAADFCPWLVLNQVPTALRFWGPRRVLPFICSYSEVSPLRIFFVTVSSPPLLSLFRNSALQGLKNVETRLISLEYTANISLYTLSAGLTRMFQSILFLREDVWSRAVTKMWRMLE